MPVPTSSDLILLVREPIDAPALIQHVRTAGDGAIVTFDGCVRNQSHGRRTLYLDYEAYETMAIAKMREIAGELHTKFSIDRVAIAHRLGRLDTLKRTVPIWKKEYFEDGAVWADGEVPPAPQDTAASKRAS
jgi:molybdopterin synthase catalytic subunit